MISETRRKVSSQGQWLLQVASAPRELTLLQEVLWNRPTSVPVLRFGQKVIDVISFSDLCEERYIDSFVVDVCINKTIEEIYTFRQSFGILAKLSVDLECHHSFLLTER